MSNPEDDIKKIDDQISKLAGFKAAYQDLQSAMYYFDAGIEKLRWAKDVVQFPWGADSEIRARVLESVKAWDPLPLAPIIVSMDISTYYGTGTSACANTAVQIYDWRKENSERAHTALKLEETYREFAQKDTRVERIEKCLKVKDQTLAELFGESIRYYGAWKANSGDLKAFCNSMRNVIDKFKGHLNLIKFEALGIAPKGDFSWNKVIDVIGTKKKSELLAQKNIHEKLFDRLSQYVHANSFPDKSTIEKEYTEYLDHIDSVINILDQEIKKKYFGIGI